MEARPFSLCTREPRPGSGPAAWDKYREIQQTRLTTKYSKPLRIMAQARGHERPRGRNGPSSTLSCASLFVHVPGTLERTTPWPAGSHAAAPPLGSPPGISHCRHLALVGTHLRSRCSPSHQHHPRPVELVRCPSALSGLCESGAAAHTWAPTRGRDSANTEHGRLPQTPGCRARRGRGCSVGF